MNPINDSAPIELQQTTSPVTEQPFSLLHTQGVVDRKLISASHDSEDWEILVYRCGELFEACFFRWAVHHEHVCATSVELVLRLVDQRIRILQAHDLSRTSWTDV
jgi:hypothetical protein